MLARFIGAAAFLVIGGVLLAGEYTGLVTKASKDSITFKARVKGEKGGKEMTVKVNGDTKYTKDGKDISASDFDKLVSDAAEGTGKLKGVFAKIKTDGEGDKETATNVDTAKRKGGKKAKTDDK
jgi:hypothetical protein